MNRQQRLAAQFSARKNKPSQLEQALQKAGVGNDKKEKFLDWTVATLWEQYNQEQMNRRLIIENEIRDLGIRLSNGTVNKEYSYSFRLPTDKIDVTALEGADELGLELEAGRDGEFFLVGRPLKTGDYTLRLRYKTVEGEPESELPLPIAFNPNPRDLWKNIPTDPRTQWHKPDSDTDYVKVEAGNDGVPRKDMVGASQRGRSHAQEGKERDDHFSLFHCDKSDWYIMAVADGAGSARYSRQGSKVACETAVAHCKARLLDNPDFEAAIAAYHSDQSQTNRTALTTWVHETVLRGAKKAQDEIFKMAKANEKDGMRPKDFATTLMVAICKRYDFGWFIASFWVGDGAMCLYDAEKKTAKLLGVPDEGEFSGQTRFLTMPEIFRTEDCYKRLRMAIVPDFTALFLMTDGVSDPMFETEKNLHDYAKWQQFADTLKNGFPADGIGGVDLSDDNDAAKDQLLGWLDFWSPGNHDDRTIAILY